MQRLGRGRESLELTALCQSMRRVEGGWRTMGWGQVPEAWVAPVDHDGDQETLQARGLTWSLTAV